MTSGTALEAWPPAGPDPDDHLVDAGFTNAIGVRPHGRVRYVGSIVPEEVVLDIHLIRSAPVHLNRAGIGDVLSCHTGLHDWRAAVGAGEVADCYPHIGAACTALGHSRFNEGSEHFWAYAYEHASDVHRVHGELTSFAVVAITHVQDNHPDFAHRLVSRVGVRAHQATTSGSAAQSSSTTHRPARPPPTPKASTSASPT